MGKGVQIGLRDVYYAILVEDPLDGVAVYEAPVRIPGAIAANINPNSSSETLFADDGPYETASTIGGIALELNMADLTLEHQAKLLGHTIEAGVLRRRSGDIPPWLAVGFRSLKSNGKYRYTWLNKGKFSIPEQANETKADSINFQTPSIAGTFVKRDSDDEWERHIDEDSQDYVPATGAAWFTDPQGDSDPSELTVTVAPITGASAVEVTESVVWTFNKPVSISTVTTGNFTVMAGAVVVPGALTVNAARTVVTFKPTGSMAASTSHTAMVNTNVKDIYNVALTASVVSTFTTA